MSQDGWQDHWRTVEHLIVDEVHALAPTKRGADLAVSLERVAAQARRDPCRVGLSATCRAGRRRSRGSWSGRRGAAAFSRPPCPRARRPSEIAVESLIRPGEAPHRGLSYRRLLRRLRRIIDGHRTTVIFANTRAFAEKITHDLRSRQLTGHGGLVRRRVRRAGIVRAASHPDPETRSSPRTIRPSMPSGGGRSRRG